MGEEHQMTWEGKRVLVTGAGGFIGSHLCETLVEAGAEVAGFVRYTSRGGCGLLSNTPPRIQESIKIIAGDLRDSHAVRSAVQGRDFVFHLGAMIAIPYSYLHPVEVIEVNVLGTTNVLNAARETHVERVIHTSTSEVYGTARESLINESHPLTGQSPYSASKIGADAIVESYHRAFGLPVATIRPFNTYGPRQSGRAVVPTIVNQVLQRQKLSLGSLFPTRDLTYVTDTVAGILAVATCEAAVGRVLNIGTGKEISIGELATMVMNRVGREVPIETVAERQRPEKSEVERLRCDAGQLRGLTQWRPLTSLEDGLDQVIAFLRDHPNWTDVDRYEV
jgi:dTDP-glucose 4,6-dehydratase